MATLRCKVCVIGDPAIGKSAFVQVNNKVSYPKNYVMTLGADLYVKTIHMPDSANSVEMHIFDTAGSKFFAQELPQYLEDADMILLAYDVTDTETFKTCVRWIQQRRKSEPSKQLQGALIGLKSDLMEYAEVPIEEARKLAQQNGLGFFLCSALDGRDVDAPLNFLAASVESLYQERLKLLSKS